MATFTHYRRRIFDRLKHFTGHLVDTEVVNILALFTRNCGTLIFSSKATINTIRKSKFVISMCNFSFLFQLSSHTPIQPRLCSTKTLAGPGVHILTFKFSTVPVKSLTPILAVKFLNGEAFKFSYG